MLSPLARPSAASTSVSTKPRRGATAVSMAVTVVVGAVTAGASFTATMSSPTRQGAGWSATLPAPMSLPIRAPASSIVSVSVTSPGSAPLRSWFRSAAPV